MLSTANLLTTFNMRRFAQFGNICTILKNVKNITNTHGGVFLLMPAILLFFTSRFTSRKAGRPLRGMELQEKEAKKPVEPVQ